MPCDKCSKRKKKRLQDLHIAIVLRSFQRLQKLSPFKLHLNSAHVSSRWEEAQPSPISFLHGAWSRASVAFLATSHSPTGAPHKDLWKDDSKWTTPHTQTQRWPGKVSFPLSPCSPFKKALGRRFFCPSGISVLWVNTKDLGAVPMAGITSSLTASVGGASRALAFPLAMTARVWLRKGSQSTILTVSFGCCHGDEAFRPCPS